MATSLAALTLALSLVGQDGGYDHYHHHQRRGWVLPPGPPPGWGFPDGNPDKVGWVENGIFLPLGADRTPDYYFPRYFAVTPDQLMLQSYFNPYLSRGQRYLPYTNCGGAHPAGGPPPGSAVLPMYPYRDSLGPPTVRVPAFTGRVSAPPINAGSTELTP
jgi:hypothetical protein